MKGIIQETSKRNSSYRNVHYMWQMEKCMQSCLILKKIKSKTIVLKLLGFDSYDLEWVKSSPWIYKNPFNRYD